jgi:TRAP-type C4-dicarboxylate transport system substrate-binding protein
MFKLIAYLSPVVRLAIAALAVALVSAPARSADAPVKLKAAYFSSDRTTIFHGALKPFVEAVNAEARGSLEIEVYVSGAMGKDMTTQAQMVIDGAVDLAVVVPGYSPAMFKDNAVIEMPGLLNDVRDATLVYTRLVQTGALSGYEDLVPIAAYVTDRDSFHTRVPVNSLKDLKGLKIRVNNRMEADALLRLGMMPVIMPINQVQEAIANGTVDGTLAPISALYEYGIGRIATHHYLLYTSGTPLVFVMNRKKFESLPSRDQGIIRKYSGEWAAQRFLETYEDTNRLLIEQTRSDPDRVVVTPSPADEAAARDAFAAVLNEWVAKDPHNQQLLQAVKSEIEKLRPAE